MTMLFAKTTDGKDLIALGGYALVANVYLEIKATYNKMWRSVIGEEAIDTFHNELENSTRSPHAPIDWLGTAKHSNPAVRALTALNKRQLGMLKDDDEPIVREMVIKSCFDLYNETTSYQTKIVCEGIIREMLDNCFSNEDIMVACTIAKRGNESQVNALASHPSNVVREVVARRTTDSELLDKLSSDNCRYVRIEVAKNMETKRKTLQKLLMDECHEVKSYAVVN